MRTEGHDGTRACIYKMSYIPGMNAIQSHPATSSLPWPASLSCIPSPRSALEPAARMITLSKDQIIRVVHCSTLQERIASGA